MRPITKKIILPVALSVDNEVTFYMMDKCRNRLNARVGNRIWLNKYSNDNIKSELNGYNIR